MALLPLYLRAAQDAIVVTADLASPFKDSIADHFVGNPEAGCRVTYPPRRLLDRDSAATRIKSMKAWAKRVCVSLVVLGLLPYKHVPILLLLRAGEERHIGGMHNYHRVHVRLGLSPNRRDWQSQKARLKSERFAS